MKQLLLLFSLLLICNLSTAQDMWYPMSNSVYGYYLCHPTYDTIPCSTTPWQKPFIKNIEYKEGSSCHTSGANQGYGHYRGVTFNTNIANMDTTGKEALVDTTGQGWFWDECHYHEHWGLIQSGLYNAAGLLMAGGEKSGYDWVSSSKFSLDSLQRLEMEALGLTWVRKNIPPVDPPYGMFTISPYYSDPYHISFANQHIIIGHYTSFDSTLGVPTGYVGLADGVYLWKSEAFFDQLGLDQGNDDWPNKWEIWVKVEGMTLTVGVDPPALPPTAPTNVNVEYKNNSNSNPLLTWDGEANYFEIERWVKHGNVNAQANPVSAIGNTFLDSKDDLLTSAQILLNKTMGVKFFYKIRAVNSSGESEWITTPIKKL